ncbi:MAG: phage tail protein [Porticoccaceae bacterium]
MTIAQRAAAALTGNSLLKLSREFSRVPTAAVGAIAGDQGYSAAGRAMDTGRLDSIVAATGPDPIARLAQEGIRSLSMVAVSTISNAISGALRAGDPPPAGHAMLSLGGFVFMVGTLAHQSLKRSHAYRWEKQDRLLRTPSRQFIGPGDESIELSGYLLPHYTGGAASLPDLRARAAIGEPYDLVDHFGVAYGLYVIENIEETGAELDIYGQPRKVDFSISLSAYGEDAPFIALAAAAMAVAADSPMEPNGSAANIDNGWE